MFNESVVCNEWSRYESLAPRCALGVSGAARRGAAARGERRRYYEAPAAAAPGLDADAELAQRTRAFRDLLADAPHDEALWLRFIEFQVRRLRHTRSA